MEVGGGVGDSFLMTPGKPMETRSKSPHQLAQLVQAGEDGQGVGMAGVRTRWRSLTGLPAASRSMALRPEPPMSMDMVTGSADSGVAAGRGASEVEASSVIRTNCSANERNCN